RPRRGEHRLDPDRPRAARRHVPPLPLVLGRARVDEGDAEPRLPQELRRDLHGRHDRHRAPPPHERRPPALVDGLPAHRQRLAEPPHHDRAPVPRRAAGRGQEDAARQLQAALRPRPGPRSPAVTAPLAGLRVVELASDIAGPYATKLLADAGADVVKIEHPDGGDPLRRWSAATPDAALQPGDDGALFRFLNASKRSVAIDWRTPAGRAQVRELAATADVVVESLAPEAGLDFASLADGNARGSLVSVSFFGREGPWRDRAATDFTLQAWGGSIAMRGTVDRPPLAAGGRLGEWLGGGYAAIGALSAVAHARLTGRGQHVDVSLLEVVHLSMAPFATVGDSFTGRSQSLPRTVEIPSIEPAADGWVGFCTITNQQWRDFLVLIERPELVDDAELAYFWTRNQRRAEIYPFIHAWTRRHTIAETIEQASLLRIPVAPIGNGVPGVAQVLDDAARRFDRREAGRVRRAAPRQDARVAVDAAVAEPRLGGRDEASRDARSEPARVRADGETLVAAPRERERAGRHVVLAREVDRGGERVARAHLAFARELRDGEDRHRPAAAGLRPRDRGVRRPEVDADDVAGATAVRGRTHARALSRTLNSSRQRSLSPGGANQSSSVPISVTWAERRTGTRLPASPSSSTLSGDSSSSSDVCHSSSTSPIRSSRRVDDAKKRKVAACPRRSPNSAPGTARRLPSSIPNGTTHTALTGGGWPGTAGIALATPT